MGRAVVMAVGVLLSGCSGLNRIAKAPPQPLQLTTIFVYPLAVTGQETSRGRLFELSQRALDVAVREAGQTLAFYGPTEFKVIKQTVSDPWVATDAIPLLIQSGSRVDQGAVLKLFVERRLTGSSTEVESKKGQSTASNEITTWLARAELVHPTSSTTLLEVSGQVVVDPFARQPPEAEWDSAPHLTALLEQLVTSAARHALDHAAARSVQAPWALFGATPAAAQWLPPHSFKPEPQLDALQQEIAAQNRARVLIPGASEAQMVALANAPAGTFVVTGDEKLKPGDVVSSVDQAPALPHTLARLRFKGAPGELEVRRASGTTEKVIWP
jgi:hypothetical protein